MNRRLGRVLAAAAYSARLTPDTVTLVSGLVSLVGILLLAMVSTTPASVVVVVFLLLLGYALDSADGQVARLRGTESLAGEWLDHVIDAARLPAFHLAVGAALLRSGAEPRWIPVVAVLFALLVSTWFFGQILAGQLSGVASPSAEPVPRAGGAESSGRWGSFAKLPSDIGAQYLMVLLLPWPSAFLVGYVALFAYSLVMASVAMRRRYLGLRLLDGQR